ncbi:MAG: S9 family peptidase [Fidelibacterota bacterium]
MIKKTLLFIFITLSGLTGQTREPLTLEELFTTDQFKPNRVENIQWRPDGEAFTFTEKNTTTGFLDIYEHDVKTGESVLLVAGDELTYDAEKIRMSAYQWTRDGNYLLIAGPQKSIWRHSTQAPYYILNVTTKELKALAGNSDNLKNVKLAPDGKRVGFVRDHNIFVVDLATGVEQAITSDGTDNILNGEPDWVYEEDFGLVDGWRWSPDGKKIAYWQFDQTRVKEFQLINEMPYYNQVSGLKYPKVGEQNAVVKIAVFDLITNQTRWMDLGDNDDIYVPKIFWTNSSSKLAIVRLNRKQNLLELLMANTVTGRTKIIITDSDPAWIDVQHHISFLKSRDEILFSSEESGFRHAYLYDYAGNLIRQVTEGNWEITEISGVDEKQSWLYFFGKKDSPLEQQVYRIRLDGTRLEKISNDHGWHRPLFSPRYQYFIDVYSNLTTPPMTLLKKADGTQLRVLNTGTIEALQRHELAFPELLTVTSTDGTKLNAYIIKPRDFDLNKKYPVIVYGYGGPGSQNVVDRWGNYRRYWHQYLAEQGYLIFCLDNRGTGGRGKAFKNLSYGDLSKWSINDQIEGAKYLATLPYVDQERIGFWGWSGGGYLTIGLLTRAADYFKVGVAVAPVTDFRTYDAMWAERHMGLFQENREGYEKANLNNYAGLLKGKLLIIHGTGDDNVHYQNTLMFVNQCIDQNKQVDVFFYPNRNHSIRGGNTRLHLFTKMTDYFNTNLR